MIANVYVHGDKDTNWSKGEELGLTGEVLRRYVYNFLEVNLTVDVDEKTGIANIISVDGRKVAD